MASNPVYTINAAPTTITWGTTTTNNTTPWVGSVGTTIMADPNIKGASLKVHGDADFDGNVTIKGKSIVELIENIEKRLAILHPNEKLEEKWEKLKKLGDEYREMEKEILHAEEMWSILNK
jgi:hypothetical protein